MFSTKWQRGSIVIKAQPYATMFFVLNFIVHNKTLLRTAVLRKSISGHTRNRMLNPTIKLYYKLEGCGFRTGGGE
jgi:hypothetical protein